ncbi:NADH dehydrogenase (quinone) subunit D [Parasedimentitalea marina]|uniref:NADH-quinone oxidoreductase subunit D n=1 Tax=Parasedimentitalea marina TaxID=2483033 RepID=A0A3T0MZZ8_9RHOB|nr:NADH dehydrogenase (quinone) subunit D [Parasedimentitalea marina]AZV77344.1 NADH dehydrogenase (quinone) subunit D [Parasedimentitalea marina]
MTEATVISEVSTDTGLSREVLLNLGPQHPSTHGVLRLLLQMDGEIVERIEPHIGLLHRGTEKLFESFTYTQIFPLTDRLDYLCPPANNLGYALAVEGLLGIKAPERAQYIRVMMAELSRISGHLLITGALPMDVGAMTSLLYTMRDREMVMDLMEMITGVRMHTSFCRVGGVREDLPEGAEARILEFCDIFTARISDYETLLENNRIFLARVENIGNITGEDAIALGLSGPNLRASGVDWDIRRDEPYEIYGQVEFDVITRKDGDCYDRWKCRVDEMRESLKIIRQCIGQMPKGDILIDDPKIAFPVDKDLLAHSMETHIHHFKLSADGIQVPAGEFYAATEAPKGELGYYLISDGGEKPFRLKVRAPSFVNLQALCERTTNIKYLADVIAMLGSLDPVMGEVDK